MPQTLLSAPNLSVKWVQVDCRSLHQHQLPTDIARHYVNRSVCGLNPKEAVRNKVLGTKTVAEAPTSVMGATKRVAEELLQIRSHRGQTKFTVVRFVNVLVTVTQSRDQTVLHDDSRGGAIDVAG